MRKSWLMWSFVPYLHWVTWIHAGFLANYSPYYGLGALYALPFLFGFVTKRFSTPLILTSWLLGLMHIHSQKRLIAQRIAQAAASATNREASMQALMQALLQAAMGSGGTLSVTQGVMATGRPFAEVEEVLNAMVTSGYVYKRNHPVTGVIEYVFKEVL